MSNNIYTNSIIWVEILYPYIRHYQLFTGRGYIFLADFFYTNFTQNNTKGTSILKKLIILDRISQNDRIHIYCCSSTIY